VQRLDGFGWIEWSIHHRSIPRTDVPAKRLPDYDEIARTEAAVIIALAGVIVSLQVFPHDLASRHVGFQAVQGVVEPHLGTDQEGELRQQAFGAEKIPPGLHAVAEERGVAEVEERSFVRNRRIHLAVEILHKNDKSPAGRRQSFAPSDQQCAIRNGLHKAILQGRRGVTPLRDSRERLHRLGNRKVGKTLALRGIRERWRQRRSRR
jgi:hypothetical protein